MSRKQSQIEYKNAEVQKQRGLLGTSHWSSFAVCPERTFAPSELEASRGA